MRYWPSENGLPSHVVRALVQAAGGYVWMATAEGVVRFDGVRFLPFEGESEGWMSRVSPRTLRRLDAGGGRAGKIWAGTHDGRLFRGSGCLGVGRW